MLYPAKIGSVDLIFGEKRYILLYPAQANFGHDVILRHVVTGRKARALHAGASARTESELPAKVKPRSEVSEAL